jgi:shikimate kinase
LACEIDVLTKIIESLESDENQSEQHIVIDTTGSAIYTGETLLKRLCLCTRVVHLSTPPEVRELMLKSYLNNKRPVLWRGLFEKKPKETNETALARCYALLLSSRERLYKRFAAVTIDYYTINRKGFEERDFLEQVRFPERRMNETDNC